MRRAVFAEEQTCWRCGRGFTPDDPATLGHVQPHALGGSMLRSNLHAEHASCNCRAGIGPAR